MSDSSIGSQMIVNTSGPSAKAAPRAASEAAAKNGVIDLTTAVKQAPAPAGTGQNVDRTA